MKRTLIGAALLISAVSPALAVDAVVDVWQGDLFVTATSNDPNLTGSSCTQVNTKVGDFGRSVFRPAGNANNSNTNTVDLLSIVYGRSALHVAPSAGTLDAAATAGVRYIYGSAGTEGLSNITIDATVLPAAAAETDATVKITITINKFFGSA